MENNTTVSALIESNQSLQCSDESQISATTPLNEYTIITRVLSEKPINMNAFKNTILKAWNPKKKVSTNLLQGNLMAWIFEDENDLSKILNLSWTFRDLQIIIAHWPPDKSLAEINLNKIILWIQAFGIPVCYTTLNTAKFIGNTVGTFIKADLNAATQKWKKSLRIQVEIDILKPLHNSVILSCNGRSRIRIEIRYERLSDFCYKCGLLGHKISTCKMSIDDEDMDITTYDYGPWIRSENSLIPNPSFQSFNPLSFPSATKMENTGTTNHQSNPHLSTVSDLDSSVPSQPLISVSIPTPHNVKNPDLNPNPSSPNTRHPMILDEKSPLSSDKIPEIVESTSPFTHQTEYLTYSVNLSSEISDKNAIKKADNSTASYISDETSDLSSQSLIIPQKPSQSLGHFINKIGFTGLHFSQRPIINISNEKAAHQRKRKLGLDHFPNTYSNFTSPFNGRKCVTPNSDQNPNLITLTPISSLSHKLVTLNPNPNYTNLSPPNQFQMPITTIPDHSIWQPNLKRQCLDFPNLKALQLNLPNSYLDDLNPQDSELNQVLISMPLNQMHSNRDRIFSIKRSISGVPKLHRAKASSVVITEIDEDCSSTQNSPLTFDDPEGSKE